MSIRMVVTSGYGNGTFNGTIKDVTLRGYSIGEALTIQIYTVALKCNITPLVNLMANLLPNVNLKSNPSPDEEVYSG